MKHSVNNFKELIQVGGVLSVAIHRSKYFFGKLGKNWLKFHPEGNAFTVTVSGQTAECSVL